MTNLVVNELLCYVQNNVAKHPRSLVGVAINGFYNDDEVTAAKLCLHGILAASDVEGLPRLIRRQPGDNRRKLECEDILALFAFADSAGCTLPTFVAANSYRLPTVAPGDVDVYALAASVAEMSNRMMELAKKVSVLSTPGEGDSQMETVSRRLDACEAALKLNMFPPLAGGPIEELGSTATLPSWAICAAQPPQPQSVKPVAKKLPVIRLKGSASQSNIKAVPRAPPVRLLKAFVGRMDLETTEDAVRAFLTEAGLNVVHCRKLKPPAGKNFHTAAFYVACSEDCEEKFYNEETWPDGVELRDWYTKS